MSEIKLLDCTLRDGGYINGWNFGFHTMRDIFRKLIESQVDYVEVGFLRDVEYDPDRALFNNCDEISRVLPSLEQRGNTKFTAMALHNKYDVNKLEPCDGKTIDAVRVTFHDYDIDEGLDFIKTVKEKGYRVFCNPINIMGYSDGMILDLIAKVNAIRPDAFSIVDTFGSMMKSDLHRIYSLLEHNLNKEIVIGLHLHENLGLAYSLAQEFTIMKAPDRNCVIDGSMLGMGRVPGNLCLELIMDYMNRTQSAAYDVNPVLDGIDDHIAKLKEIECWGYNTAYALSAKYNLHRNYAEYLLNKGRLRAKQINQILASIDTSKKTVFDEAYIAEIYEAYQNRTIDDEAALEWMKGKLTNRNVLVLAPGNSISLCKEKIDRYISEMGPLVFSANFVPDGYKVDYAFFTNPMRLSSAEIKENAQILLTSNMLDTRSVDSAQVFDYANLSVDDKGKCNNCVVMFLRLLVKLGVQDVSLAGFDGYVAGRNNYVDSYLVNQYTKGEEENIRNTECLAVIRKKIKLHFLTPSIYNQ